MPHTRTLSPLTCVQSDGDAVTSSAAASSASLSSPRRAAEEDTGVPVDDDSHAGVAKSKVTAESLGTTSDCVKAAVELLFAGSDTKSMSGATHPDLWFAHPGFLVCKALGLDTSGHDLGAVMTYFNNRIGKYVKGKRNRAKHFARHGDENKIFEVGSKTRHFNMEVRPDLLLVSTKFKRNQMDGKSCAQRVVVRAKLASSAVKLNVLSNTCIHIQHSIFNRCHPPAH